MSASFTSFTPKIAIVGAGGAGQLHARACASFPGARVAAICDVAAERAARLAAAHSAVAYGELALMLERERPDIVCVATGERQHEVAAVAALEAGAHVFCEKIMAHAIAAGERMVTVAQRVGRVLAVNFNYRHLPVIQALKIRLEGGDLGRPVLTVVQTTTYCWHHMLDVLCFLHGPPVRVSAIIDNPPDAALPLWADFSEMLYLPTDSAVATLEWSDGRTAVLAATKHDDVNQHLADFAIYGTKSRLAVHDLRLDNLGGLNRSGNWQEERLLKSIGFATTFDESFTLSLHAFLRSRRDDTPPPTSGEDGLRVMRLENAIVRAAARADANRVAA